MTQRRQMKPQTCDSISPAAEQKQIRLKTKGRLEAIQQFYRKNTTGFDMQLCSKVFNHFYLFRNCFTILTI